MYKVSSSLNHYLVDLLKTNLVDLLITDQQIYSKLQTDSASVVIRQCVIYVTRDSAFCFYFINAGHCVIYNTLDSVQNNNVILFTSSLLIRIAMHIK